MKKKGMRGKKKPASTPCITDELEEGPCDNEAVPGVSIESIHCSSRARACSWSVK